MPETPQKPRPLSMPWFKPLWRRVILVGILAVWCGWEWLYNQDEFWGMITLAALGYAAWLFFINFENELAKETGKDDNAKPES